MYAATVGKKKLKASSWIVFALIIALLSGAIVYFSQKRDSETLGLIMGASLEDRIAYLLSVGIEVENNSTLSEVTVPKEFDERFTEYNNMLKKTGFDLTKFAGDAVKKCSFIVKNRQDLGDNIGAVLLVSDGYVIAGHLIDLTSSQLYPLFETNAVDDSMQTILPDEAQPIPAEPNEPVLGLSEPLEPAMEDIEQLQPELEDFPSE